MKNKSETIEHAIKNHHQITFEYHGSIRLGEPHVFGQTKGKDEVLLFQLAGASSSQDDLPNWRRFQVEEMKNVTELKTSFKGAKPTPSGRHSAWDTRYAMANDETSKK